MTTIMMTLMGLSISAQQCSVWKEIQPCTCKKENNSLTTTVVCDKISSFADLYSVLQNKFAPTDRIILDVSHSKLEDLMERSFKELNMTIESLKLNNDNLRDLSGDSFLGLSNINYFSLADNHLGSVPENILEKIQNVKTLDLGRVGIPFITDNSLKNLLQLQHLVLPGNYITKMDEKSFPPRLRHLHLGRNKIKDLNSTLLNLSELEWLFINSNELTTLENQLPITAPKLKMIHAVQNKIDRLPKHLGDFPILETLFMQHNLITGLDGTLSKLRRLKRVQLEDNRIDRLLEDDFAETESLDSLILSYNFISNLNNSLTPLKKLTFLNLTHNLLPEFSLEEIHSLKDLLVLDVSYNRITTVQGPTPNVVEPESKLEELHLEGNEIELLNGAFSGLPNLKKLSLRNNRLMVISPDDLIGLDRLVGLDISYNRIRTLEETGKTFLPSLEVLKASHNLLTALDRDFHGLPVLCHADLRGNQIVALGKDLVSNTQCKAGIDLLKIELQDNPILCDAALPEIIAALEINKTKLIGSPRCDPPPTETFTKPVPLLTREDISIKPISESPDQASKSEMFNVYHLSKPPASQHSDPEISNSFLQQEAKLCKLQTEMKELKLQVEKLNALNGFKNASSVDEAMGAGTGTSAKP